MLINGEIRALTGTLDFSEDDLVQIHGPSAESWVGVEAGQAHQVVDEEGEPFTVLHEYRAQATPVRGVGVPGSDLQLCVQAAQGAAQLMARVRDELALLLRGGLQSGEQIVERGGEPAQRVG
ncbi:hypothetical protein GCM10009646_57780 [Streptomyces aureus]